MTRAAGTSPGLLKYIRGARDDQRTSHNSNNSNLHPGPFKMRVLAIIGGRHAGQARGKATALLQFDDLFTETKQLLETGSLWCNSCITLDISCELLSGVRCTITRTIRDIPSDLPVWRGSVTHHPDAQIQFSTTSVRDPDSNGYIVLYFFDDIYPL
jgi:hypothetical protein